MPRASALTTTELKQVPEEDEEDHLVASHASNAFKQSSRRQKRTESPKEQGVTPDEDFNIDLDQAKKYREKEMSMSGHNSGGSRNRGIRNDQKHSSNRKELAELRSNRKRIES